jgi:UDP-glucose 4-epimerase
MRRILVTGAKGFIGSRVCAEIERRGDVPVPFDHPNDVRNADELSKHAGVDAVINLAGVLGTAETIGEEYEAAHVNILGALNVFDVFRNVPIVQIATGHEGQPNPYAITKSCITGLALSRAQWMGQQIAVVRAYHVYGPGQKMCAPHGHSKVRKIIPSFVARALTDMPIEINGDGRQVVDLVYVDDCAKVLVDALDGPYGEVLEAGTGAPTLVIECAQDVIGACEGSKSRLVYGPMRRGEPAGAIVVADQALCPNLWPYKLDETVQWYRKKLTLAQAA